jgi:hypothetical protein
MPEGFEYDTFYYAGYSVFFSGLSVGLTNIASGSVPLASCYACTLWWPTPKPLLSLLASPPPQHCRGSGRQQLFTRRRPGRVALC